PSVSSVPPSISIPAGNTTGTFSLTGDRVGQTTITAVLEGVSRTALLTVRTKPPITEKLPSDEKLARVEKLGRVENVVNVGGGGGPGRLAVTDEGNASWPDVATRRAFISVEERVTLAQALRSQLDPEDLV